MSVYTKKGDNLYTYDTNNNRVKKDSGAIWAAGSVDEAAAQIAFAASMVRANKAVLKEDIFSTNDLIMELKTIENDLYIICSNIDMPETRTFFLEERIDFFERHLPKTNAFLSAGEGVCQAALNLARVYVRRCERELIKAFGEGLAAEKRRYINRLSDYLFCAMRVVTMMAGDIEATISYNKNEGE